STAPACGLAGALAWSAVAVRRPEHKDRGAARPLGERADGTAKTRGVFGEVEPVAKALIGPKRYDQQRWLAIGELKRHRFRAELLQQPCRGADAAVVLINDTAPAPFDGPAEEFGPGRSGRNKLHLACRLGQHQIRAADNGFAGRG